MRERKEEAEQVSYPVEPHYVPISLAWVERSPRCQKYDASLFWLVQPQRSDPAEGRFTLITCYPIRELRGADHGLMHWDWPMALESLEADPIDMGLASW